MVNPYQSPPDELRYTSLWTRFRRSIKRAYRSYHAGIAKDGMTRAQHLSTWMAMLTLAALALLILISILRTVFTELARSISMPPI